MKPNTLNSLKSGREKPRFGLIGTGTWASLVHAPAAGSSQDVVFTSVFGRREDATRSLAAAHRVQAFGNLDEFLDTVDIVGIAVPPESQPRFALAAAEAGKHVLLEKPVAVDPVIAETISAAFRSRGLASVVFFPQILLPEIRRWIEEAIATGGWFAARLERFAQVLTDPDCPFHGSSWRVGAGALWDTAPHAVALLIAVLGEIVDVFAVKGRGDLVSITLGSADGAVASVMLARDMVAPLSGATVLYGSAGAKALPSHTDWRTDSLEAYRIALRGLAAAAAGRPGQLAWCDASFGTEVTAVIAAAAQSLKEHRLIQVENGLRSE
jgi:predicted dehydrogenase